MRLPVRAVAGYGERGYRLPAERGADGAIDVDALPASGDRGQRPDRCRLRHHHRQVPQRPGRELLLQLHAGLGARQPCVERTRRGGADQHGPAALGIERQARRRPDGQGGREPSCEIPYPTTLAQLQAIPINGPFNGYGGGPGCSGLTPSQTNSIYNAPNAGARGEGAGANVAVFELSAYNHSDITNWAHTFYGSRYQPRLDDINVDGGPLAPNTKQCPTGDTCLYGYGGDIEVEADIEQDLTIAPDADSLIVYNAPNDETGQTELDQYATIANQDKADSVSSSWAICQPDAGLAYAEAENILFEQMAAQGESMFSSSGDTGAFECIRDGTFSDYAPLESLDPSTQPWVTSAGGTSFESFDPGSNPNPSYPSGTEAVWNTLDVCSGITRRRPARSASSNCNTYGAGGGGHSIFWPMPSYQRGPGVINRYTVYGPSNCPSRRRGSRVAKGRTSRPTRILSPVTRSTAPGRATSRPTRPAPTTRAPASGSPRPRLLPGGSTSAAPASPRHCWRPCSPIGTRSAVTAPGTPTRFSTRCSTTRSRMPRTSTTSPGSAAQHQQWLLPGDACLRRGNRDRHPELHGSDHRLWFLVNTSQGSEGDGREPVTVALRHMPRPRTRVACAIVRAG